MKQLPLIIIACLCCAIAVHYEMNKRYDLTGTSFAQLMYLPTGKYVKYTACGYDNLLADGIYLWSIQYYSDPTFRPHMEYLRHIYELITELDPAFVDAYQTGALFMFYDGRDPKSGFALLDKGFQNNPSQWIIPTNAGFYAMMAMKDNKLADHYFEQASKVPEAPSLVVQMLAGLRFRQGERSEAYQLWKRVYENADTPAIKQIAIQHVHELKVLIDLDNLRKAVKLFSDHFGKYHLHLDQLVSVRLLAEISLDPEDQSYEYNAQTGDVKYSGNLIVYKNYE